MRERGAKESAEREAKERAERGAEERADKRADKRGLMRARCNVSRDGIKKLKKQIQEP